MSELTARLDAMQARCDAATPGPWHFLGEELGKPRDGEAWHVWSVERGTAYDMWRKVVDNELDQTSWEDAELIAAARTDMPRLIAALRAVLAQHYLHDCSPEHGSWCSPCWSEGLCEGCSEDWPCPTVKSIAEALGVEL